MTSAVHRRVHVDEPHFLRAEDGVDLTLIRVRGPSAPRRGPVLLVHGVGMRAESFRPPAIRSLVDVLLEDGWDVWMLNWRGSTDLDPIPWTLDDVARNDIPAAVKHVVRETGAGSVKVIAHCLGSSAVAMAVVSGLVPEVDTVVSNGVSLHPVVPRGSRIKLSVVRPLAQRREPYVDIAWGDGPEQGVRRLTRSAVRLWHVECSEPSCNMASFALGSGHPALWHHRNLDSATHSWLAGEFGRIPMSLYAQLATSARAGQVVSFPVRAGVRSGYAERTPASTARFALFAGADNRAFLPESQRATHRWLETHQPGRHSVQIVSGYRHADVFVGRRAHIEVFPRMVAALSATSSTTQTT